MRNTTLLSGHPIGSKVGVGCEGDDCSDVWMLEKTVAILEQISMTLRSVASGGNTVSVSAEVKYIEDSERREKKRRQ
ncbi:hypothetical protein DPEC_G00326150 [Dallia pectoralis]|uniref:Uncharacterized protein n=1 Tax=Dallia pectoralis TaxID=75939 RepID=A0ACC2F836_DALPE|nr:hypothetical protein DPEC_G00326150 [Dallia pectoralis]